MDAVVFTDKSILINQDHTYIMTLLKGVKNGKGPVKETATHHKTPGIEENIYFHGERDSHLIKTQQVSRSGCPTS